MVFFVECATCDGKGVIRPGWFKPGFLIGKGLICPQCVGTGSVEVRSPSNPAPLLDRFETASQSQVGGDHYTKMKIQPIEYSLANGLGPCEANVVKYISRHKSKGGAQDLKKAKHFIDLLLQHEYPEDGK